MHTKRSSWKMAFLHPGLRHSGPNKTGVRGLVWEQSHHSTSYQHSLIVLQSHKSSTKYMIHTVILLHEKNLKNVKIKSLWLYRCKHNTGRWFFSEIIYFYQIVLYSHEHETILNVSLVLTAKSPKLLNCNLKLPYGDLCPFRIRHCILPTGANTTEQQKYKTIETSIPIGMRQITLGVELLM
jgi:hypothetical protein